MFPVSDRAFVARCDGILAYDSAIEPHRGSFAATSSSEHFCGSAVGLGLGVMHTGRPVGVVQLVDPLAVVAAVDCSVVWIWHRGSVQLFWWMVSAGIDQHAVELAGNTEVSLHVLHHRANGANCLSEEVGSNAQFLAPVTELVVLVDVDPAVVSRSGLGQVVWHGLLVVVSCYRPSLIGERTGRGLISKPFDVSHIHSIKREGIL